MNFRKKTFHLIGSKTEQEARTLTKAIQLANRYLEMVQIAQEAKIELSPAYLNWIVQSCNAGLKFFEIKPEMIVGKISKEFGLLKHFVMNSDMVEFLSFKGYDMSKGEISKITSLVVSLPQTQIKGFRFVNCKFGDESLPEIGRAIKHNGYLEYLEIDKCKISDKSLRFFSGLWQYVPFLEFFCLKNCPGIKGEIYFTSFLEKMVNDLQLKYLILSHNSLSEKVSNFLLDELFTIDNGTLEILDLSYNDFTPRENWMIFQKYLKCEMKKHCDLIMEPYPPNEVYYHSINPDQLSSTIELERIDINNGKKKRHLLTKNEVNKIKEIREELNVNIFEKKSIESIFKLCKVIHDLDHDFPPQYVELATKHLREVIFTSEDIGDHYSFFHAKESCLMIGMNKKDILPKKLAIKNKTESFAQQLTRLLNFQIPETQANVILDELVLKAIKRDYRGTAIDLLFFLKTKRDQRVNQLLMEKMDAAKIELRLMQKDPFFILEHDKEFADSSYHISKETLDKTDNLGLHHALINYEEIANLRRDKIVQVINSQNLVNFKSKKFLRYKIERSKFVLAAPAADEFKLHMDDHLLLIAKTVCQYRYWKGRVELKKEKIQKKVARFVLTEKEQELDLSEIASKILDSEKQSIFDISPKLSRKNSRIGSVKGNTSAFGDLGKKDERRVNSGANSEKGFRGMDKQASEGNLNSVSSEITKKKEIVKLPFSLSSTDFKTGLKINSFIIKICRLDFDRQRTTMIVS